MNVLYGVMGRTSAVRIIRSSISYPKKNNHHFTTTTVSYPFDEGLNLHVG